MHNLRAERFYRPQMVNGMMASADGPIKTFPLRGIKDTPPYLHDGRLLTLDDTVEFFNLVLGTQLTADEKLDLVAFLRALCGADRKTARAPEADTTHPRKREGT